ncbi:MAG: hypothetical protein ACM37W_05245 [Actinomycetota bacterium]
MESIEQIFAQMIKTDPTLQTAMQESQLQNLPIPLPEAVKETIAKYPVKIQLSEFFVGVYWPDQYYTQGKIVMGEISHLLGGATGANGLQGLWFNPVNQLLIPDDIFLIKSFTDTQGLIDNFAKLIERVCYWGRICNQSVIAVEIGSLLGSIMIFISVP